MIQMINEAEVIRTWAPTIEATTGITEKAKLAWMSKYAHYHQIYESVHNYAQVNPGMNINGMGPVTLPGDPTSITGFSAQAKGSGDKPYSLLPISMQVAAQTIGLDLVPVIPMSGPLGILTYLDFIYGGGKLDSTVAPLIIKVPVTFAVPANLVIGRAYYIKNTVSSKVSYQFTYIGDSRIDGYPIFKVVATDATTGALLDLGAQGAKTINQAVLEDVITYDAGGDPIAAAQVAIFAGTAELVKALEDHVAGFTTSALRSSTPTQNPLEPYSRAAGENTPSNMMGLTLYNKSVEAKTIQVDAGVTREQVQDMKQFGLDAVAQVESVLINELTQTINKIILRRIFELGTTNHIASKVNMNINFSNVPVNIDLGTGMDGNDAPLMSTVPTSITNLGGENAGTVQRRILSKILGAANLIAVRGRRGAANFAVTNGKVATALQDIAGFQPYPMSNTFNQTAGSLYPVGSVAGINVYVDPNMSWDDTRIAVGRKGDGNSPGIVFMPYLMADSVQTIAESTMAPKISIKSRFALVDAGIHPELYYITFKVQEGVNFTSLY